MAAICKYYFMWDVASECRRSCVINPSFHLMLLLNFCHLTSVFISILLSIPSNSLNNYEGRPLLFSISLCHAKIKLFKSALLIIRSINPKCFILNTIKLFFISAIFLKKKNLPRYSHVLFLERFTFFWVINSLMLKI